MPGKNAVDVYLAVGLRGRDFAQLEQPIFKAYYFLTANIQTISKTKTYVKKKLAGRLILHDDRQRKGCRLLMLCYKIDGTEKEISTGIYIQPRFWSARSQRIVPEYPESRQLNRRLNEFRKEYDAKLASAHEILSPDVVELVLHNVYFDGVAQKRMISLVDYARTITNPKTRCYADMFLFSVYTCGWRLSDLITLEWRNLNLETNYIDWKIQVKTKHGLELKVPLRENALEIIHRYKGKNKRFVFDVLPEKFNVEDDKALVRFRNSITRIFNTSLKVTGEKAGFLTQEELCRMKNGRLHHTRSRRG